MLLYRKVMRCNTCKLNKAKFRIKLMCHLIINLVNSTVCNIIYISCQEEHMANIPYTKAYTPNINKQINKQTDPPN